MNNNNESTPTKQKYLSFAGIKIDTKTDNSSKLETNPFFTLENTLLAKDKDAIKKMIGNYNKHSNDLDKIIYFKDL